MKTTAAAHASSFHAPRGPRRSARGMGCTDVFTTRYLQRHVHAHGQHLVDGLAVHVHHLEAPAFPLHGVRSEEHTSELQSPCNLVCRLLLEKKNKKLHKSARHQKFNAYYAGPSLALHPAVLPLS